MLATIVLPAGTQRVLLRDIPNLFADAIHPELPEGTPRILSYLQKQAKTKDLADEWCGWGNNFPISLTVTDVEMLNASVWSHLPPLVLQPEDDGPQKLRDPMPEPQWEPYAAAFEENPPKDWQLIAVWRNTVVEQWLMHHEARKQWKRVLEQRSARGELQSRPVASGIPASEMAGQQLMDSFMTVEEFADFAQQFSVDVQVRQLFTRTPVAAPLLAQISRLPSETTVTVQEFIGSFSGRSSQPASAWVQHLQQIVERQNAGYFTVGEAAQMLADENTGLDVKDLIKRIEGAEVHGRRLVREENTLPKANGEKVREFVDIVKVDELNDWLAASGVAYRLRVVAAESEKFVPLTRLLAPYFAFGLDQLPDHIAARIRKEYNLFQWHELSPSQRREIAGQKDAQADPAMEAENAFYFDQWNREQEVKREIDAVKALTVFTVPDYDRQKQLVAELETRLRGIQSEKWQRHAGDLPEEITHLEAEASGGVALEVSLLATREELVDAFGSFTGMTMDWFKKLQDTPALLKARKSVGQGGRGHIRGPLFCPFEVMWWLVSTKRKKGRQVSENKAWELLEKYFPKVYAVRSVGDPRD